MINMLPTLWGKVNSQNILSNILYHFHNKYSAKLSKVENVLFVFKLHILYWCFLNIAWQSLNPKIKIRDGVCFLFLFWPMRAALIIRSPVQTLFLTLCGILNHSLKNKKNTPPDLILDFYQIKGGNIVTSRNIRDTDIKLDKKALYWKLKKDRLGWHITPHPPKKMWK